MSSFNTMPRCSYNAHPRQVQYMGHMVKYVYLRMMSDELEMLSRKGKLQDNACKTRGTRWQGTAIVKYCKNHLLCLKWYGSAFAYHLWWRVIVILLHDDFLQCFEKKFEPQCFEKVLTPTHLLGEISHLRVFIISHFDTLHIIQYCTVD